MRKKHVWRMVLGVVPAVLAGYFGVPVFRDLFWWPKSAPLILKPSPWWEFPVLVLFVISSLVSSVCLFSGWGRRVVAVSAAVTAGALTANVVLHYLDSLPFYPSLQAVLIEDASNTPVFVARVSIVLYHIWLAVWCVSRPGREAFQSRESS